MVVNYYIGCSLEGRDTLSISYLSEVRRKYFLINILTKIDCRIFSSPSPIDKNIPMTLGDEMVTAVNPSNIFLLTNKELL